MDTTIPVMLDGYVVFRVGDVAEYPASERAKYASDVLKEEVQWAMVNNWEGYIHVDIVDLEGQITLQVNDRHLLTVTLQDVPRRPGLWTDIQKRIDIKRRAEIWRQNIQIALNRAERQRTPEYLKQATLKSLGTIAGAIAFVTAFTWLGRRALHRWVTPSAERSPSASNATSLDWRQLFPLLMTSLQVVMAIAVAYYIFGLFPLTRFWRYRFVWAIADVFTASLFSLGEVQYSLLDILFLLSSLVGLWLMVRWFTHTFKNRILRVTRVDRGVQDTVGLLLQYGLTFLGALVILQGWSIDVSSLAILVGTLGVGIGFGLQNIVNNFIGGLIIAFTRPIKPGDLIQVGDLLGTVEHIGSRSTEIITPDRISIIVPNSRLIETEVVNWSHRNPVSRLRIPVAVAYGSNVRIVRDAILEAAKGHPDILRYPSPRVHFQEFTDSALNFELHIWVCDPRKQFKLRSELNYRLEAALRKHGVEMPYPQRDVHLRSPHLEQALHIWLKANAKPEDLLEILEGDRQQQTMDFDTIDFLEETEENIDLETIADQMRGEGGVEIKDRRYGFHLYSKCFIGSDAVKWLMQSQKSGRLAAIQIGQMLLDRGIIHHVTNEHGFEDTYLFYRFYADEP